MSLQATELGLGSCWIYNFDANITRELLGLPDFLEPAVILPLGYPLDMVNPDRHAEKRKPLADIVSYGIPKEKAKA